MKPLYGLEYGLFFGVPGNKIELWDGHSRWAFPFASRAEGEAHEVQQTEVGKFQFTRRSRLVFLDVAINGRRHRDILTTWADRSAWDWGET